MSTLAPFAVAIPWIYNPNSYGPILNTSGTSCFVTRGNVGSGSSNQWSRFSYPASVTNGWTVGFDIKYGNISPATEVKLTLTKDVILRYDGSSFKYQYFDSSEQFTTICPSGIRISDTVFTSVTLTMKSDGIHISENGSEKGAWNTDTSSVSPLKFDWQILSGTSTLQAEFRNVSALPPLPN